MEVKEFKSFFKTVGGNEGNKCHYPTRLDTYGCGCQHNCDYCLDGNTEILMSNNTTKLLKDIEVGDKIIGISHPNSKYKKTCEATVLAKTKSEKASYKITLEDGTELICSDNHKWLSNRGWKYTIGEMTGENRRPYLTTNNYLKKYKLDSSKKMEETEDYKLGYLSGIIRGDGNLTEHHYVNEYRVNNQYHFRLAQKEEEGILRTENYLKDFGIEVNRFLFPMKERGSGEIIEHLAIRTHSKENWDKINELIKYKDTKEFYRGFIAGIYDAEGATRKDRKIIYNQDIKIIDFCKKCLDTFDVKYAVHIRKRKTTKDIYEIDIRGGIIEYNRLKNIFNFAITKKWDTKGFSKMFYDIKIVKIEPYKDNQVLYDITTTTENFIANGFISHNCYAKSLLDFRKMWHPENPAVADINKIRRKIAKLPKDTPPIRLGGMTDCFQPIEKTHRVTYETIKCLNENKIPYLIVTKSAMVADDEYISILDKNLAHIQITVTNTNDEQYRKLNYEKASLPSERIKAIEKLQKLGFDVQLRLSPFIPEFIDYNILNNVQCDKILVEFLRVNSWIKKWFDIDYSDYTLKQSNYNHLPLEKKKEYLSKITGFKEVTVCEDYTEHYEYWKNNFNVNPDDCCNLRQDISI